eukprot:gb/GECG01007318.1/.p1 GENE.gb/GECG01007318.1/~~gb/GECG01007318.1/.p1  ORF type:complete len:1159 (+),score=171.46 gb/GECG01007318.1/:1-3477(+)
MSFSWEQSPFDEATGEDDPSRTVMEKYIQTLKNHAAGCFDAQQKLYPGPAPFHPSSNGSVSIEATHEEHVHLQELVRTDDALFDRIIIIFASLCDEMDQLANAAHQKYFPTLAVFGTSFDKTAADAKDSAEMRISRMLPWLQGLSNYIERCCDVVANAVHQLAALAVHYRGIKMFTVYERLARLLRCLLTIDKLVASNDELKRSWELFKRLEVPSYSNDGDEDRRMFEAMLARLDRDVFSANAFHKCIDQEFDEVEHGCNGQGERLQPLQDSSEFIRSFGNLLERFTDIVADNLQRTRLSSLESCSYVELCVLYALFRKILPPALRPDIDFYKKLWKLQEREPLTSLYGNATVQAGEILERYTSTPNVKRLTPRDLNEACQNALTVFTNNFPSVVQGFTNQSFQLCTQMNDAATSLESSEDKAFQRCQELARVQQEFLLMCHRGSGLLHQFFNLHIFNEKAIGRKSIPPVLRLVEALKGLENSAARVSTVLSEQLTVFVPDLLSRTLVSVLEKLRLSVAKSNDQNEEGKLTANSQKLLQLLCKGTQSWSSIRSVILQLGYGVLLRPKNQIRDADSVKQLRKCDEYVNLVKSIPTFWQNVRRYCDCTVMFWARDIYPSLLQHAAFSVDSGRGGALPSLLQAFNDVYLTLQRNMGDEIEDSGDLSNEDKATASDRFVSSIKRYLRSEVYQPLALSIENDLRRNVAATNLSHMELQNPKNCEDERVKAGSRLLALPCMYIGDERININAIVSEMLERSFYELTTLFVHDWKTYGEMEALVRSRYNLQLVDHQLPMGSLRSHQNLDILQILRNIDLFAAKYNYNMHTQVFLQKRASDKEKFLHAVSIDSIAASIRQHGTGIVNTAVNYAHKKYLGKKFYLFQRFLADEYIKSHLSKEKRWFKKNKSQCNSRYPWSHAEETLKEIKKLSDQTADDNRERSGANKNQSHLDLFRLVISRMGNALGYVRMVRSAAMHHASAAVSFVPDIQDRIYFEELVSGKPIYDDVGFDDSDDEEQQKDEDDNFPGLSTTTAEAAKTTDDVISNLLQNFSESVNYFKLMVDMFRNTVSRALEHEANKDIGETGEGNTRRKKRKKQDDYLRNFFMIVPSLTISYINALRGAKDRLDKPQKRDGAYFSDDGFSMGIAFVLTVLGQNRVWLCSHLR